MSPVADAKLQRIRETHRLRRHDTALLVIDMQRGFLDEGASLEVPKGRAIIPNVARLLDTCRQLRLPVVFTEFVYSESLPCLRGDPFGPEHLPAAEGGEAGYGLPSSNCLIGPRAGQGAESAQTIASLAPREDELVLHAHTYDKFYGTPLDLALRSRGISRLAITGVTTDVCVNATVVAGSTRDYRVTVITDGVATIEDRIQQACFDIWQNKFARLGTADQAIDELTSHG